MKKIISLIGSMLLLAVFVNAAELPQTLRFGWEQDAKDVAEITHWNLLWSETKGTGYVQAIKITKKVGATGPDFVSDAPLIITGKSGTNVTKFFILRACTDSYCTGNSNEASKTFALPKIGAPFTFTIEVVPQ